jgi:RNA polymerase-binding transcription factor DksA
MHYHYFTLEQRNALEDTIRSRLTEPGMKIALARLHRAEYGICGACGGDIPFVRLAADPTIKRCGRCTPNS